MVSSLRRARRTTSSYACQNLRKSIPSQFLMDGTTRVREPSFLARSMAMPRLTCSGATSVGLPSTSANEMFISGCATTARTRAQQMRWVKLTFPPRPRARWLLMTMRLSTISLAGTARTEVAVGTSSEASMLVTTRAAGPRSFWTSSMASASSAWDARWATWAYGAVAGCAVAIGDVTVGGSTNGAAWTAGSAAGAAGGADAVGAGAG